MPTMRIDPTLDMYYEQLDYTDPWSTAETVVLVHGIAESSRSWYAWVPALGRRYRIVRLDLRGFGQSSEPPPGHEWTVAGLAKDIHTLLEKLNLGRVHLVSAKFGGTVGLQFAHDYPQQLLSLTTIGSPAKFGGAGPAPAPAPERRDLLAEGDVEGWARQNMGNRLGGDAPPAMIEWWSKFMGSARLACVRSITRLASGTDLEALLPGISAPTLMITASRSSLVPLDAARSWTDTIPNGELLVMDDDSYHLAATKPQQCAEAAMRFFEKAGLTSASP